MNVENYKTVDYSNFVIMRNYVSFDTSALTVSSINNGAATLTVSYTTDGTTYQIVDGEVRKSVDLVDDGIFE